MNINAHKNIYSFNFVYRKLISATLCIILVTYCSYSIGEEVKNIKDIVYIEASTGKAWKLDKFPERVNNKNYKIDFMRVYEFDKTDLVNKALDKKRGIPDAVVVQECAVYFPGNMKEYKNKYKNWIKEIKKAGSKPIIATVVPPAKKTGYMDQAKEFIKIYILGRDKQIDQIVEFNEWLRQLAKTEDAALVDLEKAVRVSEENRHMKDEFNTGDDIHINREAYDKLDRIFLKVLDDIDWK